MQRVLVTIAIVGGLSYSVYLVTGGTVSQQTAFLQDAGYTGATHVASCPVIFNTTCLAQAQDAGIPVHKYEMLRFPVAVRLLSDGGRDVQLPPMNVDAVRACFEVMDWTQCTLVTAASAPSIAALIGQQLPFSLAGAVRMCVRPNMDAGLTCMRRGVDGGPFSFGDRNVFQLGDAVNSNDCESVQCAVYFGDDPEVDL